MRYISSLILAVLFLGCSEKISTPKPDPVKEKPVQMSEVKNEVKAEVELKQEKDVKEVPISNKTEVPPIKVHPCAPCPKVRPCNPITIYKEYKKSVLGGLERVYFPIHSLLLEARIDTGAKTSSMHAENIVGFERDGKPWVRFEVAKNEKEKIQIKKPVLKTIKIKRHGEESQNRYVVNMRLNIGEISNFVEMSLTDRSQYKYPVLVGRNFLQGNAVVDVSLAYTSEPKRENR